MNVPDKKEQSEVGLNHEFRAMQGSVEQEHGQSKSENERTVNSDVKLNSGKWQDSEH
jgi:hypothetical protein